MTACSGCIGDVGELLPHWQFQPFAPYRKSVDVPDVKWSDGSRVGLHDWIQLGINCKQDYVMWES